MLVDHLLKTKKEYKNLKKQEIQDIFYQNEVDETCSQYDMVNGDFKHLPRRTASDKVLCDKTFNISKYSKFDGYSRCLALMNYKFFNEKSHGDVIQSGIMLNQQLAEELFGPTIRTFKKCKVYSFFKDNI